MRRDADGNRIGASRTDIEGMTRPIRVADLVKLPEPEDDGATWSRSERRPSRWRHRRFTWYSNVAHNVGIAALLLILLGLAALVADRLTQ